VNYAAPAMNMQRYSFVVIIFAFAAVFLFCSERGSRVAQERLAMRRIREVLWLRAEGFSEREIARSVARTGRTRYQQLLRGRYKPLPMSSEWTPGG